MTLFHVQNTFPSGKVNQSTATVPETFVAKGNLTQKQPETIQASISSPNDDLAVFDEFFKPYEEDAELDKEPETADLLF